MWEYLAVLFLGFWLGIAIFLYVSCYWVEEILDLPAVRDGVRTEERGPSASGAHARLKRLVSRVIEEAMALPALAHYAHHQPSAQHRDGALDARTYEDLLASAILNKVIERYQTESGGGRSGGASSGIHSASASPTPSAPSSSSVSPPHSPHSPPPPCDDDDEDDQTDSEWEHQDFRGQEIVDLPRRVPFPEFGGDIIHCTEGASDLNDHILEEMSGSDLQAADGSWEENWLFQKKKVKTLQSVPVPMLVPNPNSEYRAMIGDREADDTTDLSDALTDSDVEDNYKSDIGRALQSKSVIGGKIPTDQLIDIHSNENEAIDSYKALNGNVDNEADKLSINYNDLDSSTEIQEVTAEFNSSNDSVVIVGTDTGPLDKAEFAVGEIHRTNPNLIDIDNIDGSLNFIDAKAVPPELNKENHSTNNHQQEREYEETFTKPVQRYADSLRRQNDDLNGNIESFKTDSLPDHNIELIPGSVADRERKKWLQCVDMPNNPYSTEAIQKRLSNKSSSALFDTLTTKPSEVNAKKDSTIINELPESKTIPTPKVLKDILAEEVPQFKRYGRDYYINEAKKSAGARKSSNMSGASSICSINKATSLDHFDINEFASPEILIKQFNSVTRNNMDSNIHNKETTLLKSTQNNLVDHLVEYEDLNEEKLFSAKPAYIEDDTDERLDDILRSAMELSHSEMINGELANMQISESNGIDESLISSSSLEDSIQIYNVTKGEIVKSSQDIRCGDIDVIDLDNNDNVVTQDKTKEKTECIVSNEHDTAVMSTLKGKMENGTYKQFDEEFDIQLPNVKDLAKKFVRIEQTAEEPQLKTKPRRRKFSNDYELEVVNKSDPKLLAKHQGYMHSLTARSISKEFREELKLSMATPYKLPGRANEQPENMTFENSRPASPIPEPGTIKNKLAFFESLRF